MYHHSSSSPAYSCLGSNGFVPSQPSASSYGHLLQAEQDYYYSQQQQPPFRRVVSTGDVGALSPAPAVAVRYSTEERRERIEKYRSKRNQRNFQKKITYACRKTLADSRPRVKGRFARNIDDMTEQTDFTAAEVSSMMNKSSDIIAPADASSNSMPDWWPAMQGALTMEEDELYVAVSSINLY
ncbi:hypothetical protein ACQ4PT_063816 [Festuca glaucescens]